MAKNVVVGHEMKALSIGPRMGSRDFMAWRMSLGDVIRAGEVRGHLSDQSFSRLGYLSFSYLMPRSCSVA
jgi:hypothetical protein